MSRKRKFDRKILDEILEIIEVQQKKIDAITEYLNNDLDNIPKGVEPHIKAYLYDRLKYEFITLVEYQIAKKLLDKGIEGGYVLNYLKSMDKLRNYFLNKLGQYKK